MGVAFPDNAASSEAVLYLYNQASMFIMLPPTSILAVLILSIVSALARDEVVWVRVLLHVFGQLPELWNIQRYNKGKGPETSHLHYTD